ncbi:MAG: hypothetical protein FH758_11910 [Firmicutes bacterium]|nr:hypothetical protein [Bacillota bacterium]
MQVYYATVIAVVIVNFILLKKYLPRNKAIILSVFSYVLLVYFPTAVSQLGASNTVVIYILAVFLLPYTLKLNGQQKNTIQNDETDKTALNVTIQDDSTQKEQGEKDMPNSSHEEITRSITVESEMKPEIEAPSETPSELKSETKVEVEVAAEEVAVGKENENENVNNSIDKHVKQHPEQQDTYDDEELLEEPPNEEQPNNEQPNNETDTESEEEEETPEHYAHTEIVRSVTEDEVEPEEEQEEIDDEPENASCDDDMQTIEEKYEDKVIEKPAEPDAKELISKGLAGSKKGNYSEAVKMLVNGLKQNPTPDLKYLAVSEISDAYQQMGMYSMAASIIAAYIKQPDLVDHPGIKAWKEKLTYLNNLIKVLRQNNIPNKPYSQVPNFVKKKAFSMTLKKIK